MGIVKRDGEINVENMRLFTRIYAAQFYYNLCDSYAKSTVGTVLASFDELSGRKDYKGIYLFLSLQYDQLRKPLPDPVWWLMGCHPEKRTGCSFCWLTSMQKQKRPGSRIFAQGYEQADWGKCVPDNQQPAEGTRKATAICGRYPETDQMRGHVRKRVRRPPQKLNTPACSEQRDEHSQNNICFSSSDQLQ